MVCIDDGEFGPFAGCTYVTSHLLDQIGQMSRLCHSSNARNVANSPTLFIRDNDQQDKIQFINNREAVGNVVPSFRIPIARFYYIPPYQYRVKIKHLPSRPMTCASCGPAVSEGRGFV